MATSASNPDVGLVLAAASPRALFGDDEDGARKTYRRLAKSVHPDANGNSRDSAEAMARLNRLWSEYQGRRLAEITRNGTYAIFSEDGWLVVERRAEGRPRRFADGLGDVLDGSPVCQVKPVETKLIAQPDGNHVAYACEAPDALGDAIMLTSLRDRLPDGRLHPRDMAWIAKRLLFLSAALGKRELRFSTDASECLAISPASHMLAVVAPWELEKSDGSVRQQRELVGSCIGHMREMSGSARIMRFLDGVMVDNYTQSCDLLREFDELLHEMFGRPRFHVMETRDA